MADNIHIHGNITKDPELRFLTNGAAKASFSVAENRRYQVNGEWREETTFHDIVVWRKLAENVAASLKKGDPVMVFGRLVKRSYDAADGTKRYVTEIEASKVGPELSFATADVTRNPREEGSYSPRQAAPAAAAPAADDPFAADEPF